jgi:hypothetical protein
VAGAGDVNGDGYADVIVGAPYHGPLNEGRAYLYLGSSGGLALAPSWTRTGDDENLGVAVSTAGDVNGDGYADVIVGAHGGGPLNPPGGRTHVFHGGTGGLPQAAAWTVESNQAGAGLGLAVGSGDFNGDGYSDVLVAASLYDDVGINDGRVYSYHGSPSGLGTTAAWTGEPDQAGAYFGQSVSGAGDVNGDGYADAVVGAPYYDGGAMDEGRAYVYHGSPTGLSTTANWTAESDVVGAEFGRGVAMAGDVNGDGFGDVLVGAPGHSGGLGKAYLFRGSSSGPGATPSWSFFDGRLFGPPEVGQSVSSAGDVNGDGYGDVIVGAPHFVSGSSFEGAAFLFRGNDGGLGAMGALQQKRVDSSDPVGLLGNADRMLRFGVSATLPIGWAGLAWADPGTPTAFFEWEVKPHDEAFDGTGLQRSPVGQAVGLGPATLAFDELATRPGIAEGLFKWRARFVLESSPLLSRTRWFSVPGNAVTEGKLRFGTALDPPEPPMMLPPPPKGGTKK